MRLAATRPSVDAQRVKPWLPPKGLPISGESAGRYNERKVLSVTSQNAQPSPDVNPSRDIVDFFVPSSQLSVGIWVVRDPNYFYAAGSWSLARYTIRDGIQTGLSTIFSGRSLLTDGFYELPSSSVNATPGFYRATMSGPLGDAASVTVAWEPHLIVHSDLLFSLYAQCNLSIKNVFT